MGYKARSLIWEKGGIQTPNIFGVTPGGLKFRDTRGLPGLGIGLPRQKFGELQGGYLLQVSLESFGLNEMGEWGPKRVFFLGESLAPKFAPQFLGATSGLGGKILPSKKKGGGF